MLNTAEFDRIIEIIRAARMNDTRAIASEFLGRPMKGSRKVIIAAIERRRGEDTLDHYRRLAVKRAG